VSGLADFEVLKVGFDVGCAVESVLLANVGDATAVVCWC
jgi:hypothetical protein